MLDNDKKLVILCRIEPGCLGPDGIDHIADFCRYANQALKGEGNHFVKWLPLPRYDKSLAEIEYSVGDKGLSRAQATAYLQVFNRDLAQFEEQFHDLLALMINRYLSVKATK
ncbi:hypothetical protein K0I73_09600 [Shewanella mesophila]|uniref:hypothetical protein n=1 Tax=Shewanella mesophila TaxID=2864208 RepID=UPI001C65E406|nr:hypothetical protein [Shewanella mesophila]QYJ84540.1 hypothetical protein K0I73_09600 [Shewanella mesophila]